MAQQQGRTNGAEPAMEDDNQQGRRDLWGGLLGAVPLTLLAGLFAMWLDRVYSPSVLARLAYPAGLVVGCLGSVGWTRLVAGRRSSTELELSVVLISVIIALLVLSMLAAIPVLLD